MPWPIQRVKIKRILLIKQEKEVEQVGQERRFVMINDLVLYNECFVD